MRSHSTKNQLKEKSPEAKFILSSTLHALLLFKIQKVQRFSYFFPSSDSVTRPQCALARCTQPLLPGQHPARTLGRFLASVATSLAGVGSFCGGCTFHGGQQGPEPSRHATRRRPTPLALRVSLPCQRTPVAPSPWPGKHGTCSLPPTCRATPVPSSSLSAPSPSPFSA